MTLVPYLQVGAALKVFDPLVCLPLGINHEGPAPCVCYHNGVVNGQGVVGQASQKPLSHLHWLSQNGIQGKVVCVCNVQLVAKHDEVSCHPLPACKIMCLVLSICANVGPLHSIQSKRPAAFLWRQITLGHTSSCVTCSSGSMHLVQFYCIG